MPCYVIYNNYAGTWIHESLFWIRTFRTQREAEDYIRLKNLNTRFYEVKQLGNWI